MTPDIWDLKHITIPLQIHMDVVQNMVVKFCIWFTFKEKFSLQNCRHIYVIQLGPVMVQYNTIQ